MATFEIQGPDGKVYEVEGATQEGAVAALKRSLAGENVAVERATILPFSKNARGDTFFDINSGITGAVISGFTAPGDVASGKLDPNSPEGARRAIDTTGLMLGPNPMAASGDRAIPGALKALKPSAPKIPTAEMLDEAGGAGFEAARRMGVDYSSDAVKSLANGIRQTLETEGFRDKLTPKTFSIIEELQLPPADSVASLDGLIAARKSLQRAAGDFANPEEQKAATEAIRALDEFLAAPPAESVLAGPAAAAGATLKEARGNYAAAKRSEKITGAEERALDNAGAANSGLNIDNQLRQRVRDIINRPKDARGYSEEELEFMREIVRGTYGSNAARWLGNLMGGGGGLGAVVSGGISGAAGVAAGGPLGIAAAAAVPLTGLGLKKLSAAVVKKQLRELDELIRSRSPLAEKMKENPPLVPAGPNLKTLPLRGFGGPGGEQRDQR